MKKAIVIPKYLIIFIFTSFLLSYWIIKILNIQNGELLFTPDVSVVNYETFFGNILEKDFDTYEEVEDVLYIGKNKNELKFYFSDLAVIKDYDKWLIISLVCFCFLFIFYKFKFQFKE